MSGRFAPSPTGDLHLGNLRTAVVAWLAARSTGRQFIVRMEDLDRVQAAPEHEVGQLRDLAALGLDWDGEVVRQSERFDLYRDALATLRSRDLVYDCYCSRREVRAEIDASPSAPHLPPGSYPGTCRHLTAAERAAHVERGRPPAIRLRASDSMNDSTLIAFTDVVAGYVEGGVDDVVLQRNDGVPAYNLAVVVDDALQGVTQVVRGDDLLDSTPRQIHLQSLLGLPRVEYGHVPLVVGADGERLSKRHGSVSLEELEAVGDEPIDVLRVLLASIGIDPDIGASVDATRLLATAIDSFDLARTSRGRLVYDGEPAGRTLGSPSFTVLNGR